MPNPKHFKPIFKEHQHFLTKRLIYTAITRGKKLVIMIGQKEVLQHTLEIKQEQQRYTKLAEWLKS